MSLTGKYTVRHADGLAVPKSICRVGEGWGNGVSFGQWQWAPTSFMSAAHRDDASPHLLTAVELVEDRWGACGPGHEARSWAAHADDSARVRRQHRRNHRVVGRTEG